jgi:dihydropteroate synthase
MMMPEMMQTVAALNVPYIMMHKKGTPQTMQQNPQYEDVTSEVMDYFTQKIALAKQSRNQRCDHRPGIWLWEKSYNTIIPYSTG